MREIILVEANDQINGVFDRFSVQFDSDTVIFAPDSPTLINADFKFKPISNQPQISYNWKLSTELALTGLTLAAAEVIDGKVNLVFFNHKKTKVVIKKGTSLGTVEFGTKSTIKAVKSEAGGVLDLNPKT